MLRRKGSFIEAQSGQGGGRESHEWIFDCLILAIGDDFVNEIKNSMK